MQILISEKCKVCGAELRFYNKKHTLYFGPKLRECPKCKSVFMDRNGIELATLKEKDIKDYCKDYILEGYNFICFAICILLIFITMHFTSEEWINQENVFIPLFAVYFLIPFIIKCVIRYFYFQNVIYKESKERMNDPIYLDKIHKYNEMLKNRNHDT